MGSMTKCNGNLHVLSNKNVKRDLLVFITMTPSFWIVLTVPICGYIFLWIFFQFIWFKRSVVFLCCWQVRVHQWYYAFVSYIKWFSLKLRVLCCGFSILKKRWRNNKNKINVKSSIGKCNENLKKVTSGWKMKTKYFYFLKCSSLRYI